MGKFPSGLTIAFVTQTQINAGNSSVQDIFQNQQRLRENLKALEHVGASELRGRYLKEFMAEEVCINMSKRLNNIFISLSVIFFLLSFSSLGLS
jgi:hypothetical protein